MPHNISQIHAAYGPISWQGLWIPSDLTGGDTASRVVGSIQSDNDSVPCDSLISAEDAVNPCHMEHGGQCLYRQPQAQWLQTERTLSAHLQGQSSWSGTKTLDKILHTSVVFDRDIWRQCLWRRSTTSWQLSDRADLTAAATVMTGRSNSMPLSKKGKQCSLCQKSTAGICVLGNFRDE